MFSYSKTAMDRTSFRGQRRKRSRGGSRKMSARRAVEKTRDGKVKKRLSHPAWKSRKPPRDSHFPHSPDDCWRLTKTGHFICYKKGTFLMS
jgi:hypothetical protein